MPNPGRIYLVFLLILSGLLVACGSENTPTALPAAAVSTSSPIPPTWTPAASFNTPSPNLSGQPTPAGARPTPFITPLPNEMTTIEATVGPPPGLSPLCTFVADFAFPSLSQQVKQAKDIMQAQVTNIGAMIWNTTDGKPPANGCDGQHYQYSSVEITIKESYKGSLVNGSKLILWRTGAPGSLIQGNYEYFPKAGEALIFFLGETENVRRDTPNNPLNTRLVYGAYHLQTGNSEKWISYNNNTPFTLAYLKELIKDPSIEPTATPFPPTPTPYVQVGQTFQPTKYYGLDKAKSAYFKGPTSKANLQGTIQSSDGRFKALVRALDQPLKVSQSPTDYSALKSQEVLAFGFELPNNTYVSFVYYVEADILVHQFTDYHNSVQLATPPELRKILGL